MAEEARTSLEGRDSELSPSTDSMVTVRLSEDIEKIPSTCPPSLKLVTDDQSTGPRALTNAVVEYPDNRTPSSQSSSRRTSVDWEELEKTEEEQPRDDNSDESTAFLLARLERENARIETDPKAAKAPEQKRPPSLHQLKKLMDNPDPATLRYSMLPSPPPLTDLDFYAALVNNYPRTASKLPFLLSKKIRMGIPPPLRGVVWISMSGARDCNLENLYDQLLGESSPYEHQITKDLGRTFPGVDIFSQEGGEGQRMLGRVLRAFSIYDNEIGYCQGLGFLVGPLLMHMGEREAFCVLVRLMEQYELRSCFLPNMYGLHLRMFQLSQLLSMHLPELAAHLDSLHIRSEYATQWFLSFFAVTCPLPMLLRIYDVIFAEGAPETIMRVALSLLRRNQTKLLASKEFEEVMQMLLGRGLWDAYKSNADDLVNDFVGLTGMVTREGLLELETKFKEENSDDKNSATAKGQGSDLQAAASRFLGRFWVGGSRDTVNLSPVPTGTNASTGATISNSRPTSILMRRSPSKQSVSTVSSYDTGSDNATDATSITRGSADVKSLKSIPSASNLKRTNHESELHSQIEELIMAMTALQRENATMTDELRALRTERAEERELTKKLVKIVCENEKLLSDEAVDNDEGHVDEESPLGICNTLSNMFAKSEENGDVHPTSKDLAEDLERTRERLLQESARAKELERRVAEQGDEINRLKNQVSQTRSLVQESQKEKQRLEKTVAELRQRKDAPKPVSADYEYFDSKAATGDPDKPGSGLRQFKLGRASSTKSPTQPTFNKRSSSLGLQPLLQSTDNQSPAGAEQLLLELVQSKTAEALAKQEAEEARAKLEAMRKVLTSNMKDAAAKPPLERSSTVSNPAGVTTAAPAATSAFGRWASWGKRTTE